MQAKLIPVPCYPHRARFGELSAAFIDWEMFGVRICKTDRALQRVACISVVWVIHLSAS